MIAIVAAVSLAVSIFIFAGCLVFRRALSAQGADKSMFPIYMLYAGLYFVLSIVGFGVTVFGGMDHVG